MTEIRFEEQEGFGVQPEYQYPLPGPESDRKFISFALSEEVRDAYSDVPRSVRFTRSQCFDRLEGVNPEALDSIARKLGEQYLSSAYLHMMVSAVHHRESGDMISNLDYFFTETDETREPATWSGDRSATHEFLASAVKGLEMYRHLGFNAVSDYRNADDAIRGQAQALMTVTRMIFEDGRVPVGEVPPQLVRSVTSEGRIVLSLNDDRMVKCIMRNSDQLETIVAYIEERDSYDPDVLEEIMGNCGVLREGTL